MAWQLRGGAWSSAAVKCCARAGSVRKGCLIKAGVAAHSVSTLNVAVPMASARSAKTKVIHAGVLPVRVRARKTKKIAARFFYLDFGKLHAATPEALSIRLIG